MKKWTYHKTHRFKDDGKEFSAQTQLYQVGVYMIVNNDISLKFNMTPANMVSQERKFKKNLEKGEITDLVFGTPITVTEDENGLYKELVA